MFTNSGQPSTDLFTNNTCVACPNGTSFNPNNVYIDGRWECCSSGSNQEYIDGVGWECVIPTNAPTGAPTGAPTEAPTEAPTDAPTDTPTAAPTAAPTDAPTDTPTVTKSKKINPGTVAAVLVGLLFSMGVGSFCYKHSCGPPQADPSKATEMHAI